MSLNEQLVHHSLICDETAFRNTSFEPKIHELAVCQQLQPSQPDKDVNISEMIKKWSLNTEQARAFKIVAEQSNTKSKWTANVFGWSRRNRQIEGYQCSPRLFKQ